MAAPNLGQVVNSAFANRNQREQQQFGQQAQLRREGTEKYESYRAVIQEGAQRISGLLSSSDKPIQFSEDERNLLYTAADNADQAAKALGMPMTNRQMIDQAFQTPTGTQQAVTKANINSAGTVAEAQANNAGGLPQIQGQAAAMQGNAELAGTDQVAIGQAAAQRSNAQLAGTDQVAAGQAEAQRMNARDANLVSTGQSRKTAEDVNGIMRFIDTGEPVFPEVEDQAGVLRDEKDEQAKMVQKRQNLAIADSATRVQNVVSKALALVSPTTAGRSGEIGALLNVEGDAASLRNYIGTIKDNLALDKLTELRSLSVDGSSGLGQLTVVEFQALQNALADISANQDPEILAENLKVIDKYYSKLVGTFGANAEPAATSEPVQVGRFSIVEGG